MASYSVNALTDDCYQGTTVLINKLNINNQGNLDAVESAIVPAKAALWEENPLMVSFDFAHYCAIHKYLFEDLYEWAGKIRTVDISKKERLFVLLCRLSLQHRLFFHACKHKTICVD